MARRPWQSEPMSGQQLDCVTQRQRRRRRQQQQQAHAGLPAATVRYARRRLSQRDHHERFSHGAALEAAQHSLVGQRSSPLRDSGDDMTTDGAVGWALEDFAEDLTGLGEDSATAHSVAGSGSGVDAEHEGTMIDDTAGAETAQLTAQLQAAVQQSLRGALREGGHAAQSRPTGDQQRISEVRSGEAGSSGGLTGAENAGGSRKRPGILLLGDSIDRDTLIDVRSPWCLTATIHCPVNAARRPQGVRLPW